MSLVHFGPFGRIVFVRFDPVTNCTAPCHSRSNDYSPHQFMLYKWAGRIHSGPWTVVENPFSLRCFQAYFAFPGPCAYMPPRLFSLNWPMKIGAPFTNSLSFPFPSLPLLLPFPKNIKFKTFFSFLLFISHQ
jgi:hypothetical protein